VTGNQAATHNLAQLRLFSGASFNGMWAAWLPVTWLNPYQHTELVEQQILVVTTAVYCAVSRSA
jgi:hypothetical protein